MAGAGSSGPPQVYYGDLTQEEYERLFGEPLADMSLLQGYLVGTRPPVPPFHSSIGDEFTDSQPDDGE